MPVSSPRTLGLVLAALMCSCGDGGANVTMTLETISGNSFTAEYTLDCAGGDPEAPLSGTFEPSGVGSTDGIVRPDRIVDTIIWTASVDAPPGRCMAGYRLRDSESEVICSGLQDFVVSADESEEIYHLLVCEL
ncbi:MAG: hypothetical protein AAF436_19720 [Myxococcota bacterium]